MYVMYDNSHVISYNSNGITF